jgi:hypothetical protein
MLIVAKKYRDKVKQDEQLQKTVRTNQ